MTKEATVLALLTATLCASSVHVFVVHGLALVAKKATHQQSSLNLYLDADTTGKTGSATASPRRRHRATERLPFSNSEHDKLVVVRFYAPNCMACKSIQVAYERLASSLYTKNIKFVDVSIEDREEFPELDVPVTPYAQIRHPKRGLVEHSPIP